MTRRMLLPLLKKYRGLCLAMSLIAALGISILIGMTGFNHSMEVEMYDYVDEYGYSDVVITIAPQKTEDMDKYLDIDGVSVYNTRAASDTIVSYQGKHFSAQAFSYTEDDFTTFYRWSEVEPSEDYTNILLEYNFAEDNGIVAGDCFDVRVNDEYKTVFVEAIISAPETLAVNSNGSWGSSPDSGFFYFPADVMECTYYEGLCNQLLICVDDDVDDEQMRESIVASLEDEDIEVLDSYSFADSPVKYRIDDNIDPIASLCIFLPTVFFVVILCVLFLCFSILIRQCRKDIGIFRALGFQISEIRKLFCVLTLIIAAIGIAISIPIGYAVMKACSDFYRDFYPIPELIGHFVPKTVMIGICLTVLVCELATLASCCIIGTIRPVEAMTREVPKISKTPFLVRKVLKKASPMFKFNITTMLRNKKRLSFTIICIAATVPLLFTSLSYKSSLIEIIRQMFEDRLKYDCQFIVSEEPSDKFMTELTDLDCVDSADIIHYHDCTVAFGDKDEDLSLVALSPDNKYIGIPDVEVLPDDGLVLEKYIADEIGATVGDIVDVNGIGLKVVALSEQYANRLMYVSFETEKQLGECDFYAVVCDSTDDDALLDWLIEQDIYQSSVFTASLRENVENSFETFYFVVWMLLAFTIAIGLVVMITTTKTNMMERRRELSVMRTQGFQISEISRSWLLQSLTQFILACIIGIPFGILLAKIALDRVGNIVRTYPMASGFREILLSVLLTAAYLFISHFFSMMGMRRWNLAVNTKDGE